MGMKQKDETKPEIHYRHTALYQQVALLKAQELFRLFDSSMDGLTDEQAKLNLRRIGLNEMEHEKFHWQKQLGKTLLNPFIVLLSILAVVSFLTDDIPGAMVMTTMVLVSVFLTFFQEFRSSRAAERLKELVSTRVTVHRKVSLATRNAHESLSRRVEIPIELVVPGDVIHLSAGDMIPADMRLFASKDLFISQSALTGESLPVEKFSSHETNGNKENVFEQKNLCFMGTNVVSGTAMGVVLKTGRETFLGTIAKNISGQRVQTSFDKGISRFTWLMLRFMMVMVPLVFFINGFSKGQWFDAFMFAVHSW